MSRQAKDIKSNGVISASQSHPGQSYSMVITSRVVDGPSSDIGRYSLLNTTADDVAFILHCLADTPKGRKAMEAALNTQCGRMTIDPKISAALRGE